MERPSSDIADNETHAKVKPLATRTSPDTAYLLPSDSYHTNRQGSLAVPPHYRPSPTLPGLFFKFSLKRDRTESANAGH